MQFENNKKNQNIGQEEATQEELDIGEDIKNNKQLQKNLILLHQFATFKKQNLQELGCDPEQNQKENPISNNMVSQLMIQTNEYMQFFLERSMTQIQQFILGHQYYQKLKDSQKGENQQNDKKQDQDQEEADETDENLLNLQWTKKIEITQDEISKAKKIIQYLNKKQGELNQFSDKKFEIKFDSLIEYTKSKQQMIYDPESSSGFSESVKSYFDFQLRINTINIQNYLLLKENGLLDESEDSDESEDPEFPSLDMQKKEKSKIIDQKGDENLDDLYEMIKQQSQDITEKEEILKKKLDDNMEFSNKLIKRYFNLKRAYRLNFSNPIRKFQDHQVHHLFKKILSILQSIKEYKQQEEPNFEQYKEISDRSIQALRFRKQIINNQIKFMQDQKRKAANREIEKCSKQRNFIETSNQSDNKTALIFDCSKKDIRVFIPDVELQEKIEGGREFFITRYEFNQDDFRKLIEIKKNFRQEDCEILLYYLFEELPIEFSIKKIIKSNQQELVIYPFQYEMKFQFDKAKEQIQEEKNKKKMELLEKIKNEIQEQKKIKEQLDNEKEKEELIQNNQNKNAQKITQNIKC